MSTDTSPFPTERIQCQCGTAFDWKPDSDIETVYWLNYHRPKKCSRCAKTEQAQADAKRVQAENERLAAVNAKILAMIPPRFQATDTGHQSFNRPAWDKIRDWRPTSEKPWLGLIGATGASKSRISYLLSEAIALEIAAKSRSATFIFTSSQAIKDTCMAQFSKDTGPRGLWDDSAQDRARSHLASMRTCDLLLIDDLGKARATPAVAEELFTIINHRHDHNLPTIWTANSSPEAIASHMPEDMAAPFAGRLTECSKMYSFK